ncbi:MAG: DUF916 domain-containing protein [Candidatus Magasanikbacteria bacterium]|nr:DUF916 domain-containing protein [Candidatus Magasanikbacteria bacterium]
MILFNLSRKIKLLTIAFLVISSFFVLSTPDVFAFSVSPLKQTNIVKPGEEVEFFVDIINDSDEKSSFIKEVDGFIIDSETGIAKFGQFSDAQNWVNTESSKLVLKAGEKGKIRFLFTIPESAQPGAYYLGLFAKKVNSGGQVALSSRIGSLLFLYVEGEVSEDLVRTTFSVSKKLFFTPEFEFALGLQNKGTIHVSPRGQVVLKNIFGKEVGKVYINLDQRKVLPRGVWHEVLKIEDVGIGAIGPLRVELTVVYGLTQNQIHDVESFWYIPLWLIYVMTGVLTSFILVFTIGGRIVKRFRK